MCMCVCVCVSVPFFRLTALKNFTFLIFFFLLHFMIVIVVATIWRLIGLRVYSQRELDTSKYILLKKEGRYDEVFSMLRSCYSLSSVFCLILLNTVIICAFLLLHFLLSFLTTVSVSVSVSLSLSISLRHYFSLFRRLLNIPADL